MKDKKTVLGSARKPNQIPVNSKDNLKEFMHKPAFFLFSHMKPIEKTCKT